MKWYYDINNDMYLSDEHLREEFNYLVEYNHIEYNKNQFNDYINNCIAKNGQLEEVTDAEDLQELNQE